MRTDVELYETDPFGNRLVPNMMWRGNPDTRQGVYYCFKGKKKQSTKKRTFKDGMRAYHEIMKAWNDGESGWNKSDHTPTLKDYFQTHYRLTYTILKTPLKRSDPRDVRFQDDQLIQFALHPVWGIGNVPIGKLTSAQCQQWTNKRRAVMLKKSNDSPAVPVKEGTVAREVSFLHAVFQKAVEEGIIDKNPWARIETEAYEIRNRIMTLAEQDALEAALHPRWKRWLQFMVNTGLRLDECRGIDEKTDLDFKNRTVRVIRKSRGRKKKIQLVPLSPDAYPDPLDILQEQLAEDGQLWHQNEQRHYQVLEEGCERAKLDWRKLDPMTGREDSLSPHSLRHTFATRFLQAGGDIYVLSQILGHASVRTTERHYAHLVGVDLLARMKGVRIGHGEPMKKAGRVVEFKRS